MLSKVTFERACVLFDEFYNDTEGLVVLGGYTFLPAEVLAEMDPVAYRDEVFEYVRECLDLEIVGFLSKADKVQLIIEHMVQQGVDDAEAFLEYLKELPTMSNAYLDEQLEYLEAKAV